jgi:hypothetical protein
LDPHLLGETTVTIFDRALSDRERKTDEYFKDQSARRKPRREQLEKPGNFTNTLDTVTITNNLAGGVIVSTTPQPVQVVTASRIAQSTVTVGWKSKKKTRSLPMNSYYLTVREAKEIVPYYFAGVNGNDGTGHTISMDARAADSFWPTDYYDGVSSLADERATRRLAGKASLASVNLGIMFAERKKTANLILSSATRLYKAAVALKKGRLGDLYAAFGMSSKIPGIPEYNRLLKTPPDKRLANHWLEYNFGWVPLLQEIDGACELLAKHAVGNAVHGKIAASARVGTSNARALTSQALQLETQESRIRYVAYCRLDNECRNALAETGITNPLSVVWEVLPYTFVIDWFIPVSAYLKRLQAFDGFAFEGGTRSRLFKGKLTKKFAEHRQYGPLEYSDISGESVFVETRYEREGMGSFPSQIPPSFRNPLEDEDIWKPLTTIALLAQVFRGSRISSQPVEAPASTPWDKSPRKVLRR